MAVKKELLILVVAIWWIALVGFIAPALISAASTEMVLFGAGLLLASAYGTYRLILGQITKENKDGRA